MGYYKNGRYRPNATERREYAERIREARDNFQFIQSDYPIRNGCKIKYCDKMTNNVFEGEVVNNSYGTYTDQHTFTILLKKDNFNGFEGTKKLVKGRNLYDRLLSHIPGKQSKTEADI